MPRRILCLDFDGVIHMYTSPWEGPEAIADLPVFGAFSFMHRAIQHFDIAVLSSRSSSEGGRWAMERWMKLHAGPLWENTPEMRGLNQVTFPTTKPAAWLTLDDRAMCFQGIFPAIEQIKAFKPWNKQ